MLAQHRCQLDVEVVERDDAVDAIAAREMRGAEPDVCHRHVAADVKELVHRFARPVRLAQLLVGQQQHATALAAAFAQELLSLEEGRDAEDGYRHWLEEFLSEVGILSRN